MIKSNYLLGALILLGLGMASGCSDDSDADSQTPINPTGQSCHDASECGVGYICNLGKCAPVSGQGQTGGVTGALCQTDDQCAAGLKCMAGQCAKPAGEDSPVGCTAADYPKCDGQNNRLTCENGEIKTYACSSSQVCKGGICEDKQPGGECTAADYPKCDGQNNRLTCENGEIKTYACPSSQVCKGGICEEKQPGGECTAADYPKCDGQNNRLTCENGEIKTYACSSSQVCKGGICEEKQIKPECENDAQCKDGFFCNGAGKCEQSATVPEPECVESDYPKCDDKNSRLTCENGRVKTYACSSTQTCKAGKCEENPCKPDEITCKNGMKAICQADKTWKYESCDAGEICTAGQCVPRGKEPEQESCGKLTITGSDACQMSGSGSRLVLRGDVLGLEKTWLGGSVVIENGIIKEVGCNVDMANATVITCPNAVISPGLINGHEHIGFSNGVPAKWGDERFDHRHDWRKGQNGHTKVPGEDTGKNNGNSVAEMRALLSGTTSLFGSNSATGLARNLDTKSQTVGGIVSINQAFPLADSGGRTFDSGCGYTFHKTVTEFDETCPYGPHIAEGINQAALNELRCLAGEGSKYNIFKPNTAVIHGVGASVAMVQKMAQNQMKLIWSPRTNISLYGDTAQVPLYTNMGVVVGLGTDWLYSGSANMLRELKCVDYLNRNHYSLFYTDYEIWKMATYNNAVAFGVEKHIGQIAAGYIADIAIYKTTPTKALYRAIIDAENVDVLLVVMGGNRIMGDANIMSSGEELDMCGTAKKVDIAPTKPKSGVTFGVLQEAANYGMFFCKTPENEPSCVPQRTRPADTTAQQTTLYDGDFTAQNDADGDGIPDDKDNCPTIFNPIRPMDLDRRQSDADSDGFGDICDPYPLCAANDSSCEKPAADTDGDTVPDNIDNCIQDKNPDQLDTDGDGKGNVCDPCPNTPNPGDMACPADALANVLNISCTQNTCKNGVTYAGTFSATVGSASVSATGRTANYADMEGISMSGGKNNALVVTGLNGISKVQVLYVVNNPKSKKATFTVTAGTAENPDKFSESVTSDYVSTNPTLTALFNVSDPSATQFKIAPQSDEKETDTSFNRIHFTQISWE